MKTNKSQPDLKINRASEDTFFPKKTYRWPTGMWKDIPHH